MDSSVRARGGPNVQEIADAGEPAVGLRRNQHTQSIVVM
jgi:hypothetical protein